MKPVANNSAVFEAGTGYTIGQVLQLLLPEHGDLTLSKLRFLEDQGLIQPKRTHSGYRKFFQEDVERLRLILTLQRDHFLPLKVIAEVLEKQDAGGTARVSPNAPNKAVNVMLPREVVTRAEVLQITGASAELLFEATSAGLLPSSNVYSADVVAEVHDLVQLEHHGISPRHLRSVRSACDREAQLIATANAARGLAQGSQHAVESAGNLANLLASVHAAVLRRLV